MGLTKNNPPTCKNEKSILKNMLFCLYCLILITKMSYIFLGRDCPTTILPDNISALSTQRNRVLKPLSQFSREVNKNREKIEKYFLVITQCVKSNPKNDLRAWLFCPIFSGLFLCSFCLFFIISFD